MTQTSYEAYVAYESICKALKDFERHKFSMVGRLIRHTHDIQGKANDIYEALALLRKNIEISRTVEVSRTVTMDGGRLGRIYITDTRNPYQYSEFPHVEAFIRWARAEGYWRAAVTNKNKYVTFYPGQDVNWPD